MIPILADNYYVELIGEKNKIERLNWSKNIIIKECSVPIYSVNEQIILPFIISSCDIFISPHYNIPLLPIRAKKRIVIIHDVNHLIFQERLTVSQKIYANVMLKAAQKYSDTILTVSEFSRAEIIKYTGLTEKNIEVIYPYIPKFTFTENLISNELIRIKNRYNLSDEYLLYVGSIKPHKNFGTAVKAFELLLKDMPDKILAVVGIAESELHKDSEVFDLMRQNEKLKSRMIFTGYIEHEDMPFIYKGASVLVFPSLYEGFGLPPLEAMASNCPVVVSNTASLPEVCNDAALYFDPNNYESIYKSIRMILSDKGLVNKLIENGRKNLDRFSEEIFNDKFQKSLDNIININS